MKSKKPTIFPKYQIILDELGENIRLARKRRKLTMVQIAERADVSRTTLFLIESGSPSVALGYYFNVLRTLNLEMDILKIAKDDVFGRKLQDLELLSTPETNCGLSKVSYKISSKIHTALKRGNYENTSELVKILGCNFEDFKKHLNNNKYGFKVGDEFTDIDHITPISSAKTEEEVLKLYNYKNLQLLPSFYNRTIKCDNVWDKEHFEKWFSTF